MKKWAIYGIIFFDKYQTFLKGLILKKVYILLTRTGTVPARMIHLAKGGTFTHASLSMTPSTDNFFSYARRKIKNPFKAGLIVENIHTEVFAQYPQCHSAVYELVVSDEAYENMNKKITYFFENYNKAKYNFLGLIPIAFGIKFKRKFRLTCSQFVAVILQSSEEIELPKSPYLMLPNDFPNINGIKKIYDGILDDCVIEENELSTV